MAQETAQVPVTVHVPPPPSSPPSTIRGNIALLPAVPSPETWPPYEPVIGDVKMTLDDLKASLLRYYSRLYAVEGQTVDERIQYLRQYHYPSPYPITPPPGQTAAAAADRYPYGTVLPKYEETGKNFVGRVREPTETVPIPPPGDLRRDIAQVLEDVKTGVDAASRRLASVSDDIDVDVDDPAMRAFGYRNVPRFRRRPYFGTQRDFEEHLLQLYSDLYQRAEYNERKLRALRHRMMALQMASLAPVARLKNDPRIGY